MGLAGAHGYPPTMDDVDPWSPAGLPDYPSNIHHGGTQQDKAGIPGEAASAELDPEVAPRLRPAQRDLEGEAAYELGRTPVAHGTGPVSARDDAPGRDDDRVPYPTMDSLPRGVLPDSAGDADIGVATTLRLV